MIYLITVCYNVQVFRIMNFLWSCIILDKNIITEWKNNIAHSQLGIPSLNGNGS